MRRSFGTNGERTALYPLTHDFIESQSQPLNTMLMNWRFFKVRGFSGSYLDGKPISYSEYVGFEGAPHDVFWGGLFEPYIEAVIKSSIQWIIEQCSSRNLVSDLYVSEARALLCDFSKCIYWQMAEVDAILRGNGHKMASMRSDIQSKIDWMRSRIDALISAYTLQGSANPREGSAGDVCIHADSRSTVVAQIGGAGNTILVHSSSVDHYADIDALVGILRERIRPFFRISDEDYNELMPQVFKLRTESGRHHRDEALARGLQDLWHSYATILDDRGLYDSREEAEKMYSELADRHASVLREIDDARRRRKEN